MTRSAVASPAAKVAPIRNGECACRRRPEEAAARGACGPKRQAFALPGSADLTVDAHELEADRVADRVLSEPTHGAIGGAPVKVRPFTTPAGAGRSPMPPSVAAVLASAGAPLDAPLRQDMERRFGHDFSRVRIHDDDSAGRSARDVSARAYTVGQKIVFAAGRYAPATPAGRRLIAHELSHVLQQSRSGSAGQKLQRAPAPGSLPPTTSVPGGVPPTAPREEDRASKGDVCPSCICSPEHEERLEAARGMSIRVYERAIKELKPLAPPVRRLFEATFGPVSASPEAVATTAETFGKAAGFLKSSKVWTPTVDGNIHCDQTNATDGCAGGPSGYYRQGNVVICGEDPAAAQMLNPPTVPTVLRTEGTVGSTDQKEQVRQVPDPAATKAAQTKSDEEYAARLTALLAHEAVHHAVRPGVVDIYRHERLSVYLGGSGKKLGIDLAPLALQNPDSLVLFAFKAPAAGSGSSIPGAYAALTVAEKPSGKMSVRPVIGRRRARLVVALAQEAIEQADETLSILLSEVESVKSGGSDWTLFPPWSQEMVQLLTDVGKETAFAQPDSAAATRLEQISAAFGRLVSSMRSRKLVVGRRFLLDKPKARIEIAIPDWRAFRKMSPADQFSLLIRTLLSEEPVIGGLAEVVIAHAATRGGMAFLQPDRNQAEETEEGEE